MRHIKLTTTILAVLLLVIKLNVVAQEKEEDEAKMKPQMTEFWEPEVDIITPGETPQDAPSDAIILFNGTKDSFHENWESTNGEKAKWKVANGCVTVKKRTGGIATKKEFGDAQLHIEWRAPEKVVNSGQGRGNSGVFMQSRYELQVLDNYENKTYRNGQAGSIYKQYAPLVNACKKPGEWQVYDIIYTAPRFKEDGTIFTPARFTVLHNGVLIQNNVQLFGPTKYIGLPKYEEHGKAPLMLQDHGDAVSFRNIWIREL